MTHHKVSEHKDISTGLKVIFVHRPHMSSCAVHITVRSGFARGWKSQLAHITEHMLFRGTEKFPSQADVTRRICELRADCNAVTDDCSTTIFGRAPAEHVKELIDLLLEITLRPRFDASDLTKERDIVYSEVIQTYDDEGRPIEPSHRAFAGLWGMDPWEAPESWDVRDCRDVTVADVKHWHARNYVGRNMHVVIAGPDMVSAEHMLLQLFKDVPSGAQQELMRLDRLVNGPVLEARRDTCPVSMVALAWLPVYEAPQYLATVERILDNGPAGLLFQAMRGDNAIAYDANASYSGDTLTGAFAMNVQAEPTKLSEAMASLFGVAELAMGGVFTPTVVRDAVRSLQWDYRTLEDTIPGLARWHARMHLLDRPVKDLVRYRESFRAFETQFGPPRGPILVPQRMAIVIAGVQQTKLRNELYDQAKQWLASLPKLTWNTITRQYEPLPTLPVQAAPPLLN